MIELKTTFNNYTNNEMKSFGVYLFRVVTAIPMSQDVARNNVVTKMLAELEGAQSTGNLNETRKKEMQVEWSKLRGGEVKLFKETKHLYGEREIYAYQLLIQLNQGAAPDSIVRDTVRTVYRGWNMEDDKVYCPMPDVAYQIVEFGTEVSKLLLTNDSDFNDFIRTQVLVPEHNICVSTTVDTTKTYNRNSIMKVKYNWYTSMVEAFDKKDVNTAYINDYSSLFPALRFVQVKGKMNGAYCFSPTYKSNPHLEFIDGVAFFWDGQKSRDMVEPYISRLAEKNVKMLNVLQFCDKQDFFYGDMRSNFTSRKVILHFMNRERIFTSISDFKYRNGRAEGRILCMPRTGKKKRIYNLSAQSGTGYVGELIIPVDNNNSQEKALEYAIDLISRKLSQNDVSEEFAKYKNVLFDMNGKEEDILSQWFGYCTRSMRNTDDNIIRTYVNMKENLEREYKEIGSYLNCYDFSKCQPIPKVTADKKLLENYYKTLQIEPKNIIIKSINNKKIKPISEVRPTVRFMIRDKKRAIIGEFPLNKCYNAKTNEMEMYYNKMKGEVTHVKTQNWR